MIVGVDYSTYAASLCAVPLSEAAVGPFTFERLIFRKESQSGEDEAFDALKRVEGAVGSSRLLLDADTVWIERGHGASRRADFWLGAFYGALVVAISARLDPEVVNPLGTTEWKRETLGRSMTNAGKSIYIPILRARWGFTDDLSEDDVDAAAIALVGRGLAARAAEAMTP